VPPLMVPYRKLKRQQGTGWSPPTLSVHCHRILPFPLENLKPGALLVARARASRSRHGLGGKRKVTLISNILQRGYVAKAMKYIAWPHPRAGKSWKSKTPLRSPSPCIPCRRSFLPSIPYRPLCRTRSLRLGAPKPFLDMGPKFGPSCYSIFP